MSIQSLPAPPPTPRGQPISDMGAGTPTMFDVDVLTWTQIDAILLNFPIFPAAGNGVAQSRDFGSENRQKVGFFVPQTC